MFQDITGTLKRLLGDQPPQELTADELSLACSALLVHCAKADGQVTEQETQTLRDILKTRFSLTDDETEKLIGLAEDRESEAVDIHRFTRILHRDLNREERIEIVSLLWQICIADDNIDYVERSIVTLVAQLMHVELRDVIQAKHRITGKA